MWRGNPNNNVPNIGNVKSDLSETVAQESKVLSEKLENTNRAEQVRRDPDIVKNYTIRLIDIDTTISNYLDKLQFTVVDEGNKIKVPIYYASPEKWKSIQKDGVIRDYNGKLILPAMTFHRTTSEKDHSLMTFNRYLRYPVMKKYSEKNRYTRFNMLVGQNVPVHEVYDVMVPDQMKLIYHFILWTEYIEQMNTLIERFNFETEDYWGDARGYRFRTEIDSFSHTVEVQTDQDRMIKSEFDLIVHGYLMPDFNYGIAKSNMTTIKRFTPKKIVMGAEVVATSFDPNTVDRIQLEKWRNQNYPNLPALEPIVPPPAVMGNPLNTSGSIDSL